MNSPALAAASPPQQQLDERVIGVAEQLLQLAEADALREWEQLSQDALAKEIIQYQGAVQDLTARLQELGDPLGPGHPDPGGADAGGREGSVAPGDEDVAVGALTGQAENTAAGAPGGAGPSAAAGGSEFAHLGEEGVDYTFGSVEDLDPLEWQIPPHCIPIHANVTTFDWHSLAAATQFDVIMMDPPWQLATANPTRGVALGYSQLTDDDIAALPIPALQQNGYLFVWVINAKYRFTLDLFDKWGYSLVDEIVWVKMTVNRRLAKSHGYYLQHAKEVCLVGKRGSDPPGCVASVGSDIIFSERRGQSQKPEEVYQLIEEMVPQGRYLEIFARKNNLRNFWVSVGNEVTGTGLPDADLTALETDNAIPGAVYGRAGGGGGGGATAVAAAAAAATSAAAGAGGGPGDSAGMHADGAGAVAQDGDDGSDDGAASDGQMNG